MTKTHVLLALCLPAFAAAQAPLGGASPERGMYGNSPSRNMVSGETGLASNWDPKTGENIRWVQPLGSQSYGGPVVAGGRVFVGTNNEGLRNPELTGDRGNVMAFDAESGAFLWQSAHRKHPAGPVNDWPLQGVCSTPYVDGDRLWYVSNRAEVICADTDGFRDGDNDGPFRQEEQVGRTDADIVWKLDMMGDLGVFPHNMAAGSPLVVDGILYTVTGNGVGEDHVTIPAPQAPSFLALDAKSGKVIWQSNLPGEGILHGSWSNPALGVIAGKPQVVFPGGDGWLYAFEPRSGKLIWRFDCNPKDSVWELGGRGTRNNIISTPVIYGDRIFVSVGQDPENGEGDGHLWAIDATLQGDVTARAVVWHLGGASYHRSMSTAAIHDGLLYVADLSGFLYCLDLATGQLYWTYDAFAAVWGSPLVADGKVYLGDEDGDVAILETGKKMELLAEINMGRAIYTTPAAANGILYISSRTELFAIQNGIPGKAREKPAAKAAAR